MTGWHIAASIYFGGVLILAVAGIVATIAGNWGDIRGALRGRLRS
jgi:hypothetical protein